MKIHVQAALSFLLFSCATAHMAQGADHPPLAKAPFDAKQAQNFQQNWAKHIGKEKAHTNSIGMQLKLIPPGEYMLRKYAVSRRIWLPALYVHRNATGFWRLITEKPSGTRRFRSRSASRRSSASER